jgi:hypothetical protein
MSLGVAELSCSADQRRMIEWSWGSIEPMESTKATAKPGVSQPEGAPSKDEFHHFLPQSYLKRFWLPRPKKNPQLFSYDLETMKWSPRGVKRFGGAPGLNSPELPGVSPRVVEDVYGVIERNAIQAIRDKLDRGLGSTLEEHTHLSLFLAAMMTRVPSFRDDLSASISRELRTVFAHVTANDLSWASVVEALERKTGVSMPEHFGRHRPNPDAFVMKPKKHFVLSKSLERLAPIAKRLGGMRWNVIEAPRGAHFITSDRPCFLIDPANPLAGFRSGALGNRAEIIFPLSKERALIVDDRPMDLTYGVAASLRDVEMINLRVMIYAHSFIVSSSKAFPGVDHLANLRKRVSDAAFDGKKLE